MLTRTELLKKITDGGYPHSWEGDTLTVDELRGGYGELDLGAIVANGYHGVQIKLTFDGEALTKIEFDSRP